MPFVNVETSWIKFGNCRKFAFVGRDAIAMASGIHLRFHEPTKGGNWKTRIERFADDERGDGVSCLAGLTLAPIFSVVERRSNPRVSVFAYPTMRRISRCAESEKAIGYLCCAFAGTEYLVGQATFPDFQLTLWRWRTGERLTTIAGDPATFDVAVTRIACSNDSPYLVSRFTASTRVLSVHRILTCSRTTRLFPIETDEASLISCTWSPDGTLFCCDELRNVWSVDFDRQEDDNCRVRTIVKADEDRLSSKLMLIAQKEGVIIVESLSDNDVRATFYKNQRKSRNDEWTPIWTHSLPSYPRHAESDSRRGRIVILGENGDLYEMHVLRSPRIEFLSRKDRANYEVLGRLSDFHLGALDRTDCLTILEAATGDLVSQTKRLSHHGKVSHSNFHPVLPILACCSVTGNCVLVDASTPRFPKITGCAHLQREPFNLVKFSEGGRLLGVAATPLGRLFLLLLGIETSMKVMAWLDVEKRVIDFLIYETEQSARALVLCGDSRTGNEIAVYSCRFSDPVRERVTELPSSFESIHYGGKMRLIGIPYLTKQLHRIELKENLASLSEALPSLHQMKGIEVQIYESLLLTYGRDGLVVLRDLADPRRVLALFVAHHRDEGGVRCAVLADDAIVSLGRNGDLIASKLPYRTVGRGASSKSTSFARWNIPARFEEEDAEEGWETWIETTMRRRSMAEEKQAVATRLAILDDWDHLKHRVKKLLDLNETLPSEIRLPVSAFDLDRETRERKIAECKSQEEAFLRNAEERIARLDRSSDYLRKRFLDPLLVRPKTISPFFGRTEVTNYPLVKLEPSEESFTAWCRFSVEMKESVSRLENEEEEREQAMRVEVENPPCRGFVDVLEACAIAGQRERESKVAFNERFDEMQSTKRRETKVARERAKETSRLIEELKHTFNIDASSKLLVTPGEVAWDEFVQSSDESVDQMRSRECEEAVEEKDDFYRQTLERMMDGVLELRLQDNAKKSVPKPDCLDLKDPSNYTEEDIRAIESYDKKIHAQEAAREEYRTLLETEIERIREDFFQSLRNFDDKLKNLATEKVRVEQSTLSQVLFKVRAILRHRRIVQANREIRGTVESKLVPATERVRSLTEECDRFETELSESKLSYENACKRDKTLEAKFRAECSELKPSTAEYLVRQYRKRPKMLAAAYCTSVAFLAELAECVVEEKTSEILSPECLSYLRAMNELDATLDLSLRLEPSHWHNLCRHRRLKLDAEIKVKTRAIELAEAEQSLAFLRNACTIARATVKRHRQTIERMEAALTDFTDEQEVALVLKAEQVQVRIEGCPRTDCQDAVLIPREELRAVITAIAEAERQRSVSERRLANVGDIVSLEEWRHARAKTRLCHLSELLKELDAVKVTRVLRESLESFQEKEKTLMPWVPDAIERKKGKLADEIKYWRRKNAELEERIARARVERDDLSVATRDPFRRRINVFRRRKMRAIKRKACLARRLRHNLLQLSILENYLEVSKLRTYPTLRFRF
ncbi:uncharacterized protein LOC113465032 [Ceratina calcarata]|uniref:Uncharacterized protein LOC113465032 n=1 Tax=Ceratina calcarata TaxID=156304 RepID=A0AAJ7S9Y2_9HYME|nr:uncharacterized protein LOC113465032 [Ceratina calcarata]